MGKKEELCRLLETLGRNYVKWPNTFSECSTDGCSNSARGGYICADCTEKLIADIVGTNLASRYHSSIKISHGIFCEMEDKLEE